jgi:ABC-type transport system involved in multi-copper enzyme maturation permease subunit
MWLLTTLIAAICATILWYVTPKLYKFNILSLMLWGAVFMILVDHVIGYEGGSFFEMETEGLISSGPLLGFVMLLPVFILWIIVLVINKPKEAINRR